MQKKNGLCLSGILIPNLYFKLMIKQKREESEQDEKPGKKMEAYRNPGK